MRAKNRYDGTLYPSCSRPTPFCTHGYVVLLNSNYKFLIYPCSWNEKMMPLVFSFVINEIHNNVHWIIADNWNFSHNSEMDAWTCVLNCTSQSYMDQKLLRKVCDTSIQGIFLQKITMGIKSSIQCGGNMNWYGWYGHLATHALTVYIKDQHSWWISAKTV